MDYVQCRCNALLFFRHRHERGCQSSNRYWSRYWIKRAKEARAHQRWLDQIDPPADLLAFSRAYPGMAGVTTAPKE